MDSDIFTTMASYNFNAPIHVTTTIIETDEDEFYQEGRVESEVIALDNRIDAIPSKTIENHLNNNQKLHDNPSISFNKTISFDINKGDREKRLPDDNIKNSDTEKSSHNINENTDGDRSKKINKNCKGSNRKNNEAQKTKHCEKCVEIIPNINLSSKEYDALDNSFIKHSHDFLKPASKTILTIIDALNKYEEYKKRNPNITPKDEKKMRRKYLHKKEVALTAIDSIISEVFLPMEHDEELKKNFLSSTLRFSKKYNVTCTRRKVETLFHAILEWKKLKTKYGNLYRRLTSDKESYEKNKILKSHLDQPTKPMVFSKTYFNRVLPPDQNFSSTISGKEYSMDGINLELASSNTNVQGLETAAVPTKTTTSNTSNVCIFSSSVADGNITINIDPTYLNLQTFTTPDFSQILETKSIQKKETKQPQKFQTKSNPEQRKLSVLNSNSNNSSNSNETSNSNNSYIDQNLNHQTYQKNVRESTNFQNYQMQNENLQNSNIPSNNSQYSNSFIQNQYISSNCYFHNNEFVTPFPISEYGQNNNNFCSEGYTRTQQVYSTQTVRDDRMRRNFTNTHVNPNIRTNQSANYQQNNDTNSYYSKRTQNYPNASSFLQEFQNHIGFQPLTQEQQPITCHNYPPPYPPPSYPNVTSNRYSLPTTNEYFIDSNIQTQYQQNPIEYHRSSKSSDSGYMSPLNFTESTYPTSNAGTTNYYYAVQQNTINQNASITPPRNKCQVCSKSTFTVCPGCMTYYCCKACQALDLRNHLKICKNVCWEKNRPSPNVDFQSGSIQSPTIIQKKYQRHTNVK